MNLGITLMVYGNVIVGVLMLLIILFVVNVIKINNMKKLLILIALILVGCEPLETCVDLKTRYYYTDGTYSHTIEEMWCE